MEKARTGIRVPVPVNTALVLEAQRRGISKNALIACVLTEWLERNQAKERDKDIEQG